MTTINRLLLGLALAILTAMPASALVYGPDKSGIYGGAQGIGGLDNEVDEAGVYANQPYNNFFGDAVGEVFVNSVTAPTTFTSYGYGLSLGGYGPEPGSYVNTNTSEWRDHYADFDTGFIYFGARYYEARSGRFLSADPMGHDSSMSLYDYCNGDPVNGLDPDGRQSAPGASNFETDAESQQFGSGYSQQMMSDLSMLIGANPQGTAQAIASTNPLLTGNLSMDPALGGQDSSLLQQQTAYEGGQTAANITVGAGAITLFGMALASKDTALAGDIEAGGMRSLASWLGLGDSAPSAVPEAAPVIAPAVTSTPDFYVTPDGVAIPATGYRAVGGPAVDEALEGNLMSQSGPTYITFTNISGMTGAQAQSVLQLKYEPSYFATFNTLQLENFQVPTGRWNTTSIPEPITTTFPEFGEGGASQVITTTPIKTYTLQPFRKP